MVRGEGRQARPLATNINGDIGDMHQVTRRYSGLSTNVDRNIGELSTEDQMVAALLGLKAQQLSGYISDQEFCVRSMHVIWCAGKRNFAASVLRRVTSKKI